jgi:spore coat polysaccharide biosynthesis protein SpsF
MPAIEFMVRRVRRAQNIDALCVATSLEPSDDALAELCKKRAIDCYRGSLLDVLDRFAGAAERLAADHMVRLTGDCPLIDVDLVDRALSELSTGKWDYVSNVRVPTYPDGLDVEAFTIDALRSACNYASLPAEREHVTPYLRSPDAGLRILDMDAVADFSGLRWTMDYADDYTHITSLIAAVGATEPDTFDRFDIYRAIERGGLHRTTNHLRSEARSDNETKSRPATA